MAVNRFSTPVDSQYISQYVPIPFQELYAIGKEYNTQRQQAEKQLSDYVQKWSEFESPSAVDTQRWYDITMKPAIKVAEQYARNPELLKTPEGRSSIYNLINSLPYEELSALKSSRNIGLVIFGKIKSQIEELVPVPIFAVGYLSDEKEIACLYNAVDAFVSSSLDENLPNTLMESLACGTPCVGFRTGGIPEMIEHKKNGYVAEYGSAEDLARGIQWVLDYPDKEALSRACVEKVEKEYAEEVVARKYLECYQYLCRQETKDQAYEIPILLFIPRRPRRHDGDGTRASTRTPVHYGQGWETDGCSDVADLDI